MSAQILLRRGTAAAWVSANPLLLAGEPGVETDTLKFKIGNGVAQWVDLPYASGTVPEGLATEDYVDNAIIDAVSAISIPTDISELADATNIIPSSIEDLGIADGEFGEVLTASGNGVFSFEPIPVQTVSLDEVLDVNITIPEIGQTLRYDGVNWSNEDQDTYSLDVSYANDEASFTLTVNDLDTVSTVKLVAGENIVFSTDISGNIVIDSTTDGDIFFVETAIATATGQNLTLKPNTGITILGAASELAGNVTLSTQDGANLTILPDSGRVFFGERDGIDGLDNANIELFYPSYDNTTGLNFTQGFDNANAIPFRFTKARGTISEPATVQANDSIGRIDFWGRGIGQYSHSSSIVSLVASNPVGVQVPSYLSFFINDGTGLQSKAILSQNGFRTNVIRPLAVEGNLELYGAGTGTVRLPAGTTIGGVPAGFLTLLGTVANAAALPVGPNEAGDAYLVEAAVAEDPATLSAWDGAAWVDFGDFQGPTGADGEGLPIGGTAGQILVKLSENDYEFAWADSTQVNADWAASGDGANVILNKPTLATVATSGSYTDLINSPTLFSGSYNDLTEKPAIPTDIFDLGITDGTNGQVLTTNGAGALTFTTIDSIESIDDLTDVTITTPSAGQVLKYDGNFWVNSTDSTGDVSEIEDLTDVTITTPIVGQILKYDGNFWINTESASGEVNAGTANRLAYYASSGAVVQDTGANLTWDSTNLNITGTVTATGEVSYVRAYFNTLVELQAVNASTWHGMVAHVHEGGGRMYYAHGGAWQPMANSSDLNMFKTIAVLGQPSVEADTASDTLTLVAGDNITITTDAVSDTITISSTGSQGATLNSRATLSGTSPSLTTNQQGPIDIAEGYKTYALLKVQTSAAAWVRIYVSEAARQADAGRTEGTDPLPGAGVVAEVITTGAQTVLITPGTIGFNNEAPVTENIPIRVTNLSDSTAAITVTLTAVQLEA